jgi:hypothetical protein
MNSHESPNQVLFFHSDQTLPTGAPLWEPVNASTGGLTGVPTLRTAQVESMLTTDYCSVEQFASALALIVAGATCWLLRKNKGSPR